ncbi:hypothetical protein INR49_019297 [Caranx melampygus]|nr:hypothetical protein INR49_019297 [Caranx melampygus]
MYPDWDPSMSSGRGGGPLDTPNMSPGLLGPAPMSSGQTGGMSSSWGGGGASGLSGNNQLGQNTLRSRVVVVKYDRKPLSNKTLFAFTEPFGRLREHLVLKNKAFLEMSSMRRLKTWSPTTTAPRLPVREDHHLLPVQEAHGHRERREGLGQAEGQTCQGGQRSQQPGGLLLQPAREEEKKKELLTIAGRFGIVENTCF